MPTTTKYIWDEESYLAEADGTNTINVVYTNGPQRYGNLVSTRISGTTSYHHFDAIGSTRQLTNAADAVTDRMIYDAWGTISSRTGATGVAFLWIGELGYYNDSELNTVYVRSRPFGLVVGRWTTLDPLEFADGSNLYLYSVNSPAAHVDPSGKLCKVQSFKVEGTDDAPISDPPFLDNCKTFLLGSYRYGQPFHAVARFTEADPFKCCCCEFRQYKTGTMRALPT